MTATPTICLSMIVRDEAHVVTEALASVGPHIDYWVVVDTGSVDDTMAVVEQFFAERSIPGELHEREWKDFGTNRSEALELCRGHGDYAWVMDADDAVEGDIDLSGLHADAYLCSMGDGDHRYWRALFFRLDLPWRYEGVLHEYPMLVEGEARFERLEGDYMVLSRRLGARSNTPDKYRRDAELLEAHLADHPGDARTVFYLAQSWSDAGEKEEALARYRQRAEMGGWDEEVYYSKLQVARCLETLGRPWPEVLAANLEAWQQRPSRAEPLVALARNRRLAGEFDVGHLFARRAADLPFPESDNLFVDAAAHRWGALDELGICAFYVGRHREAFDCACRLLTEGHLPDGEWDRVVTNRDFAVGAVKAETLEYPASVVDWLTDRLRDEIPRDVEVTLTITTCRRLDLFEATMNSFLNCCADLDRIGRFVCIDDGSPAPDRERMRARYPFFEFVWKGPEDAGHAQSMEQLRALVDSPWWLHLEDDWHFVMPDRYVGRAIEVLEHEPGLGQVLFNKNYGETLFDREIVGGAVEHTGQGPSRVRFRRHRHISAGTPEYTAELASHPPRSMSNTWWPHFSLRPSMLRTAATDEVGGFDAHADHFELEYAQRYADAGWESAFFDLITCLHLGPLTTEWGEGRAPNAYDLNDQRQFGLSRSTDSEPEVTSGGVESARARIEAMQTRVINLDRRPDRWSGFLDRMTEASGPEGAARCTRHPAVDGATLTTTPAIEHLFANNDFGSRRAVIACALSHLEVWRRAARSDGAWTLVFEDDAEPTAGFWDHLTDAVSALGDDPGFDIGLLGFHPWPRRPGRSAPPGATSPRWQPIDWSLTQGGTFAYVVPPSGARRLVELADDRGMRTAVDEFLRRQSPSCVVAECVPHLATAPVVGPASSADSDIQHDPRALEFGTAPLQDEEPLEPMP